MCLSAFLRIIFFTLFIIKANSFSFTYKNSYEECSSFELEGLPEEKFTPEFISQKAKESYFKFCIYLSNNDDFVFNFDDFNVNAYMYFFKNVKNKLYFETKMTEFSPEKLSPKIIAKDHNIVFDNPLNEKILIPYNIECKTLTPKNPEKHLYFSMGELVIPNLAQINDTEITIQCGLSKFELTNDLDHPISINFIYNKGPYISWNPYVSNLDKTIYSVNELVLTTYGDFEQIYGDRNLQIITKDKQKVTITANTEYFMIQNIIKGNGTITCENGITKDQLLVQHIKAESPEDGMPTFKGNWIMRTNIPPTLGYEEGYDNYHTDFRCLIMGSFIISTQLFHFTLYGNLNLILTEQTSTLYLEDYYYYNNHYTLVLDTENDIPSKCFLEGKIFTYNSYDTHCLIHSNTPNLQIYIKAQGEIRVKSPTNLIYKEIGNLIREDNTKDKVFKFAKGGTVKLTYGFDGPDYINKIYSYYEEYFNSLYYDDDFDETTSNWANSYISFAQKYISQISDIFNSMENKISPITVDIANSDDASNAKNNIVIKRHDIPFSYLYNKDVNKVFNAVCVKEGKINKDDWVLKFSTQVTQHIYNEFGEETGDQYMSYIPEFDNSNVPYETVTTENERCIGVKVTGVPPSTCEIIIYSENQTFLEMIPKVECIVPAYSHDLDVYSRLKNKNSKNFIVLVTDDLREGRSINLNQIRVDSNIFLIGFKSASLEEVYKLYEEIQYEHNDLVFRNKISQFVKNNANYQASASVSFRNAQTFFAGLVKYTGTRIHCQKFIPFLSTFTNLEALSNDFSAETTITDSVTYKSISSLKLKDLVLFPDTINEINLLSVNKIVFQSNQWNLQFSPYETKYPFSADDITLTINTANVGGKLYLYSLTSQSTFEVAASTNSVKAISLISNFLSPFNINNINGIFTLEKEKTKSVFARLKKMISSMMAPRDNNANEINFAGDWTKVAINGKFEIDSGEKESVLNDVPATVANAIEVKSNKNIVLNTNVESIEINQLQITTAQKQYSFQSANTKVSFNNLIFSGGIPSEFSLKLGTNDGSDVNTNNVIVESGTSAKVKGELHIKNAIELGPGSSLQANTITFDPAHTLKLNYRLSSDFATIPSEVNPNSITLNYIGESDNVDDFPDYSSYSGLKKEIKSFSTGDECTAWLNKITLDSSKYPEFRGNSKIVSKSCENSVLILKVDSIPKGEIDVPVFKPEYPPNDYEQEQFVFPEDLISPTQTPKGGSKLSGGAIAGIVIGCVAAVAIAAVLVWFFVFRKKSGNAGNSTDEGVNDNKIEEN